MISDMSVRVKIQDINRNGLDVGVPAYSGGFIIQKVWLIHQNSWGDQVRFIWWSNDEFHVLDNDDNVLTWWSNQLPVGWIRYPLPYTTAFFKRLLNVWPLLWRHNGRDGVSNHQPHHGLLNRLFRRRSKKTSKLRVTGLSAGNSPVSGPRTKGQ